jgi:hypothetical protein
MKDMYTAVAKQMPKLQEPCNGCQDWSESIDGRICTVCNGLGWLATQNLQNIIMNIEYNFTIVLQHDMIGWMADVTLDGIEKNWLDNERPVYGDPVTAVYAGLYRAITKFSRSPDSTPHNKSLHTNLDVSH